MSWLTDLKPKLSKLLGGDDNVPENVWLKCPDTGMIIHKRELENNMYVSPHSDHHFAMPVQNRLQSIYDDGNYELISSPATRDDPLKFKDSKKYTERLKISRKKTGCEDAIILAYGMVGGNPLVVALFNFAFMGGSMGSAVGEGIVKAGEFAIEKKAGFMIIPASGGARMQEGIISLMQMARTTVIINRIKKAKLPYIVLLTNPTTGGVSASFAMIGDIHIAEPKCIIGFAGRRVIEQTVRETLPADFQTAEYLENHGMVDMVVHRHKLKDEIAKILDLLMIKKK
ncbi:MAG: acetyl-CoA carboxylase, carboxyltransferase subunit beta [Alphaproteobacteria bacterium]|nr:acetyl-CoA carboxylase, carboxyltransferase subunit beta [Alphaproteobacteria bacterium]